ncbi:uncharacterized protein BDW43DRAFT_313461 [Aspergillus alliaceus]|uniref:uncharacterized protein n=1 Tax=Petromyces alliaceus TaxID=209559 RepID=UPI0012A72EDA|nr:uncharacterized protein BDW43DRAFT_313461 [Aspergillus alliaceus]KAB8230887.1 hypothetical protein BDW43DRAFT_313461 [Aspergillus alliaceus]
MSQTSLQRWTPQPVLDTTTSLQLLDRKLQQSLPVSTAATGRSESYTTTDFSTPRRQILCLQQGPEGKVPAFIIKYKAPHKVSLAHIRAGLQDIDLDEVLCLQGEELPEDICRRIVAAIIV